MKSEILCIKWNEFQTNMASYFQDLRDDKDFADVTLVCEDNNMFEVHKVIISSASNFFRSVLAGNKHPHPLIYMRDVRATTMEAVVDFIYHGEVNINQDDLNSFLQIAEDIELKGLEQSKTLLDKDHKEENGDDAMKKKIREPIKDLNNILKIAEDIELKGLEQSKNLLNEGHKEENGDDAKKKKRREPIKDLLHLYQELEDNLQDNKSGITSITNSDKFTEAKMSVSFKDTNTELDVIINTMLQKINGIWKCTKCGFTDKRNLPFKVKRHIETHIDGIAHPCGHCGKVYRSRGALQSHIVKHHTNKILFTDYLTQ